MEDQEDKHILVVDGTWHMYTLNTHMCTKSWDCMCPGKWLTISIVTASYACGFAKNN